MNDTKTLIRSSIISLLIVIFGLFMLCVGTSPRINVDGAFNDTDGLQGGSSDNLSDDEFLSLLESANDDVAESNDSDINTSDDPFSDYGDDFTDDSAVEESDDEFTDLLSLLDMDDDETTTMEANNSSDDSDDALFEQLLALENEEASGSDSYYTDDSESSTNELDDLEQLLNDLDETEVVDAQSGTNSQAYANIEEEVKNLESILEEKNTNIDEIQNKIFEYDEKIAQLETDANLPAKNANDYVQYASYEQDEQTGYTSNDAANASSMTSTNPGDYDLALEYFYDKQYSAAINSFQKIRDTNSNQNIVDNCQYWIGECHFGIGNYFQAIVEFEKVFSFDSADKRDDAQIMMGLAYIKLGEVNQAKNDLTWLVDCYYTSEYSSRAKQYMSQL